MAFRETIEAVLKVKDANRFKAGIDKAARSIRKLGRDEEEAAAQTKLLKEMSDKLEKQSYELTAALTLVAHSVDELGDEMVQTAAKAQAMNAVMKKSGSNAVFLGKSWAFWKDRLSLTRSEMLTTALTIGAYFSPAIIALGSSFAYAAIGGGAVAGAGLATFIFGLVSLSTVIKPVIEGVKKVTKAQDQYNLAVEQYGASSLQASRASAHLYGIIKTQGGKPVSDAANNIRKLKKQWATATAPARTSLLGTMNTGLDAARTVMPTMSMGTNQIAQAVETAMKGVFKILSGNEMRQNFRSMFQIFEKSIGPGLRGFANVLLVIGRIIRAVGPWVIKWAQAWERTTNSWKRGTSDSAKLSAFFDKAVENFKAWWGLAKALGRVLKTVFSNSHTEGLSIVYVLTDLVNRFNDWLTAASDSGKIATFWDKYNQSVTDAVWALQNPIQAINKWLPQVMDAISTRLAALAPKAAGVLIKAFLNSGSWAQLLTVAWAMKKFGLFKEVGKRAAAVFIVPFLSNFGTAFTAAIGGEALAGSLGTRISAAMTTAGRASGAIFGKAFIVGFVAFAPLIADEISKALLGTPEKPGPGGATLNPKGSAERKKHGEITGVFEPWIRKNIPGADAVYKKLFGGALGGMIPPGDHSVVGESGPEIAFAGARGTKITPLSRNSRNTFTQPDVPNLAGAFHITVYSNLTVNRREIARAISDQAAYDSARRGGTPLRKLKD